MSSDKVESATQSATFDRYGDTAYSNVLPQADRLFVSAACPNTATDKKKIWYNAYIDGAKWGVAAIIASVGADRFLMKKWPVYQRIDAPRRFFIWTLASLAVYQYNLEATEVSMMTKINTDTLYADLQEEKIQHQKFIEEYEANKKKGIIPATSIAALKKNNQ